MITAWLVASPSTRARLQGMAPDLPWLPHAQLRSPRLLLRWGFGGPLGLQGCAVQVASACSSTALALGS